MKSVHPYIRTAVLALAALFYLYYGVYKMVFIHFHLVGNDFSKGYFAAGNFLKGQTIYATPEGMHPYYYMPLTALLFAELCERIGLPPGVVNIITGAGETGAAMVAHADVNKVAFTGSTEVGRIIRKATAGTGKKISLEMGGKSPFVVFEDADRDTAVEGVVDAIWFNQGQVCCAGSRLLMQ